MRKLSPLLTALVLAACTKWTTLDAAAFMEWCTENYHFDASDCARDAEQFQERGCSALDAIRFLESVPGAQDVYIPECISQTTTTLKKNAEG
jgi:hypothetical protein